MNVRFADGYVEKTEGFHKLFTLPKWQDSDGVYHDERVLKIHLFKKADGTTKNIIHTDHQVYVTETDDNTVEPKKLIYDSDYEVSGFGHISCVNAFDEYYFTALGTDIYYWNPKNEKAQKLEGTFDPPVWQKEHVYEVGDIVKPTDENYNGYIYKCVAIRGTGETRGESDDTEPIWVADLSTTISEVNVDWVGVGSLEVEGSSETKIRAQFIELFKGFLFIANTTEDGTPHPYRVRWSQWQNPRLWHNNEDGSGLAGYVDVDDTEGRIIGMKRIGDALYIYKENSIIAFTYTGDEDLTFSKEVVTTKAGLVSEDAVVELPHMNIFMSQENIYAFDGNTCTPIGDSISDWFFYNKLGKVGLNRIFGYYDERHNEVMFCFNSGKNTGTGVVEPDVWKPYERYKVGEIVRPTVDTGYFYKCTVAGIEDGYFDGGVSSSVEPTWVADTETEITEQYNSTDKQHIWDITHPVPPGQTPPPMVEEDLPIPVKWIGVTKKDGTFIPKDISFEQNNDLALVFSTKYKTWSIREMNVTAMGRYKKLKDVRINEINMKIDNSSNNVMIDSSVYANSQIHSVAGDNKGNIYVLQGDTDERRTVQEGYHGYVITKTHHMEEPGKIKRLLRIQFHIETQGNYNLYCQVGSMWNPEGDDNPSNITWTPKMYMNLKEPKPWENHPIEPYVDLDISARYFRIKFGTEKNDQYFKILGYTLYYQIRGDL